MDAIDAAMTHERSRRRRLGMSPPPLRGRVREGGAQSQGLSVGDPPPGAQDAPTSPARGEVGTEFEATLSLIAARHFAAVTSIAPVAVRPKRSGRYMSSTKACGWT